MCLNPLTLDEFVTPLSPCSNGIGSDFVCSVEVYSHVLHDDLSIASTPRKLKRSIHSSISRTVGRKLAQSLRDELSQGDV